MDALEQRIFQAYARTRAMGAHDMTDEEIEKTAKEQAAILRSQGKDFEGDKVGNYGTLRLGS